MIELAVVALIVSGLAGMWDLKTTEVPDELAVALAVFGLAFWYFFALTTGAFTEFAVSAVSGTVLLVLGLAMFHRGQWGEADAWILAGVAYTLPFLGGRLFIADYLLNLAAVGAVYMIVYAIITGFMTKNVGKHYVKDLKNNALKTAAAPVAYLAVVTGFAGWASMSGLVLNLAPFAWLFAVIVGFVLFWRYALVLEKKAFRRRVRTDQLAEGDVPVDGKWVGLSTEDIAKLKKGQKTIVIKEGIRFVPAFALALFATIAWGNVLFLILSV